MKQFSAAVFILSVCFALSSALIHAADAPPFGANVQLRDNLVNSRTQFETTKKGRVVFMGGSITEMDGYRPMVCEMLKKRFPATDFTFISAGISSTCSTTGAFRLESEILNGGPVDLLFVEFAVNDDQDAHHTREECIRGLEGIIRHARQANPKTDIVVTFFVNEGMLKTLQDGKTPLTIEAHDAVAAHYAISTINVAKEVAEEISAQKLTWKQYGGVHPAKFGNAICASMIDELFTRASDPKLVPPGLPIPSALAGPHPLPEPLDPLNYSAGRFIEPKLAVVKSGWTFGVPDWKAIKGGKRERFSKIPMLSATEAGAELTLDFEGTAVGAFIVAGPDAGIAEASIDDGRFTAVDSFHAFSKSLNYPRTIMFATGLKPGQHKLTLRMLPDTKSEGHAMRIINFAAN